MNEKKSQSSCQYNARDRERSYEPGVLHRVSIDWQIVRFLQLNFVSKPKHSDSPPTIIAKLVQCDV